jgi:hypothetical protein
LNGDNTFLNGLNIFLGVIAVTSSQRFRNKNVNGVLEVGYDIPATDNNTGVIRCVGGISANMQSWFNGILIPASSSLSIGNFVLTNTLMSYLTSITSPVQEQINNILRYQSGQILQTKIYSNSRNSIVNTANSNGTSTDLLNINFTPKSLSSQILVSFDAKWSVNGAGDDIWQSYLIIKRTGFTNQNIALKQVRFNNDNRDSSVSLFPIIGAYSNGSTNPLTVTVHAYSQNTNDVLNIDNYWCLSISEVNN